MKSSVLIPFILFIVVSIGYILIGKNQIAKQPSQGAPAVLGQQIKISGCQTQGTLPDSQCTPGSINPSLTASIICSSGWSTSQVRNVPVSEKRQVYQEYGLSYPQPKGFFEADHLIPLELGGANDTANLWPEAADPTPGFHQKDIVENYLHEKVCNGDISLGQAQQEISGNWLSVFQHIPNPKAYLWGGKTQN